MTELRTRLRERETQDLQRAIEHGELTSEAAGIAASVLAERGAAVPVPMREEELQAEEETRLRRSNTKFWLFAATVAGWFGYAIVTGMFEPGQGQRLQHSVFWMGLFLAAELGLVKALRR